MKKLSTLPDATLMQLLSQIQTEEEYQLFVAYREIQHLRKEISSFANESVLCKLLHLTEIEAYEHLQKTIREKQTRQKLAANARGR